MASFPSIEQLSDSNKLNTISNREQPDNLDKSYTFHSSCNFIKYPAKGVQYCYKKIMSSQIGDFLRYITLMFKSYFSKDSVEGIITRNGGVEEGYFKNGLLNGNGKRTHADGEIEEGLFINGSIITGTGKLSGSFKSKDMDRYGERKGEFVEGNLTGKGAITYLDGVVEEGVFKDNYLDGEGVRTYSDGSKDIGVFKHGLIFSGTGKRDNRNGIVIQTGSLDEGTFANGRLVSGKRTYNTFVEEGTFHLGRLNGQGKRTRGDGEIEIGIFENGELHGEAKRIRKDGTVESGIFRQGRLNGEGVRTHKDGKKEEGNFENGLLKGNNTITYANGDIVTGFFCFGELNGKGKIVNSKGAVLKEGEFKDGHLKCGTKYLSNGDKEEGDFKENVLISGKKTYSNGVIEEGRFQRGSIYGGGPVKKGLFEHGRRTYPNGEIEDGWFANGVLYVGREYKGSDPKTRQWKQIQNKSPFES